MAADHVAELVIEQLALSEAELIERVASLDADVCAYRDLALAGVQALHDVTVERDRLRKQLAGLRDEYRALREQLLAEAAA